MTGWPNAAKGVDLSSEPTLQIVLHTARTLTAWTFKSKYRSDAYRRKRKANLLALRDAFRGRFGRMGDDVAAVCYGTEK